MHSGRWLTVLNRDVTEETGTAANTLIWIVSLSIVFFLHGRNSIIVIKVRISRSEVSSAKDQGEQGCARFPEILTFFTWTCTNWEFRDHKKLSLNRQFQCKSKKNYQAQTPQNLPLTKILHKFRKMSTPLSGTTGLEVKTLDDMNTSALYISTPSVKFRKYC